MPGEGKASETRSETRLPFYSPLRVHFNIHKHPPSPGCCQQSLYCLRLACRETPAKPWAPAQGRGLFFPHRFFLMYVFNSSN